MIKNQVALAGILLVALSWGAAAQSQQHSQLSVCDIRLGINKNAIQPSPPVNIPTVREITDAIVGDAESADRKNEIYQPAPPPDNSDWYFNFFLVIFTGGLVLVGGGQCYLIFRSLKATETAADAAKDAANTAHEALIKGQRAFVSVAAFPWLWRPDADRPGKYFYDITATIENAGNTPTIDMTIVSDCAFRDTPLPDDFDFPYRSAPKPSMVGPRQNKNGTAGIILDDDLVAVQLGKKYFYIWGTITYRDIFYGTPLHTTEYATQIVRVNGDPLKPQDHNNPKGTSVEIYFGVYEKYIQTN